MADAMRMASAASQPVNPPVNNPATRPQPTVRTIDVAAYMRDGQKSLSKKDYKRAKRFFQEVLGQEPNNQEAKDAIAQINATDTSTVQASDDDPQLSRYIGAFYSGQYATAEQLLNTYIFNSPRGKGKLGLANFYLGASMMTRYYLTGANDTNLKREAETKFKAAKAVDGFAAPEKFVSPKIMKAFQEAS
jgi:TolA-binding protein